MPGRVFISCGQATPEERRVAGSVSRWFTRKGFRPYVAIQAQSLADVNSGIIGELKRSDFYVFIDFRREELAIEGARPTRRRSEIFRGSLFTNQELALAQALQFEKVVFLQQEGVQREGFLRYMTSNAEPFAAADEVPRLVARLVKARGWHPGYSRHLTVGAEHWTPPLPYRDHTGIKRVRVFELDIHNRRNDLTALNAVARLAQLAGPDGTVRTDIDISPLKTTGQYGYVHTIWSERHAAWDLFAVHMETPATISLNSALDVLPRASLISAAGQWILTYEVCAVDFPVLTFDVKLVVSDDPVATTATVEKRD